MVRYNDLVEELELKCKVDSIKYQKVQVWPLIRIMLFYHGVDEPTNFDFNRIVHTRPSFKGKIGNVIWALNNYIAHIKLFYVIRRKEKQITLKDPNGNEVDQSARFLFFYLQSHRRQVIDDQFSNIFLDPLKEIIQQKRSTISLELGADLDHFNFPRYGRSCLVGSAFQKAEIRIARRRVWNNFLSVFVLKKKAEVEGFDDFKSLLPEHLQVGLFYDSITLVNEAEKVFEYQTVFEKLLKKHKTKVAIQACFYHNYGLALNLACAKLNINSVDVQHGMLEPLAYCGYRESAQNKFTMLPKYFWLWEKDSCEVIFRSTGNRGRALLGGNVWMHRNTSSVDSCLPEAKELVKLKSSYKKTVLFSMQPMPWSVIPDFVFDATADKTVLWLFRMHPRSSSEDIGKVKVLFAFRGIENVDIRLATMLPLPFLIRQVDVHVTGFSSIVFDAAIINKPTIFVDPYAIELYSKDYSILWNSGMVSFALDATSLNELLQKYFLNSANNNLIEYFGNQNYYESISQIEK